jgi:glycosyltransferase involved in cell wall biosynthesis
MLFAGPAKWAANGSLAIFAARSSIPCSKELMRVLQILDDDQPGDVRTLAEMLEHDLRPHGIVFETAYLFPRPGLTNMQKLSRAACVALRIWNGNFDAVLAYQAASSILAGVAGWLAGCRLRVVHQTCTPGAMPALVRWADKLTGALGLYTLNVAKSAVTWGEFKDYPARYRRAISLIEHGLDQPEATRTREETRRRFGLPATSPVLLNVGRLVAQKNQRILIHALPKVPDAHLVLAGHGPEADAYRQLAAQHGVANRLHLLGALSPAEVADLYAAADLFVFPSIWETFGFAAVEAGMVGTPMVVADVAILRELLDVEEPVAFVPPHDIDAWARAIRTALDAPPSPLETGELRAKLSLKYSRARMIEAYLRVLAPSTKGAAWNHVGHEISA